MKKITGFLFAAFVFAGCFSPNSVEQRYYANKKALVLILIEPANIKTTDNAGDENKIQAQLYGNGVIVSESGHIITCVHLFPESEDPNAQEIVSKVSVSWLGETFPAEVVAVDFNNDIIALKMNVEQLPKLPAAILGDEFQSYQGEPVYVFFYKNYQYFKRDIFAAGMLGPLVDKGFFEGNILMISQISDKKLAKSIFFLPVLYGASGSGIYNSQGFLVGMTQAFLGEPRSNFIFGISASAIKDFLTKNNIKFKTAEKE